MPERGQGLSPLDGSCSTPSANPDSQRNSEGPFRKVEARAGATPSDITVRVFADIAVRIGVISTSESEAKESRALLVSSENSIGPAGDIAALDALIAHLALLSLCGKVSRATGEKSHFPHCGQHLLRHCGNHRFAQECTDPRIHLDDPRFRCRPRPARFGLSSIHSCGDTRCV